MYNNLWGIEFPVAQIVNVATTPFLIHFLQLSNKICKQKYEIVHYGKS